MRRVNIRPMWEQLFTVIHDIKRTLWVKSTHHCWRHFFEMRHELGKTMFRNSLGISGTLKPSESLAFSLATTH